MTEGTRGDGDEYRTGPRADGDGPVRPGDRVVHTTDLGKEYEFTVADVDATWLTFETGQMVHWDRFAREDFAVVRADDGDAETPDTVTPAAGEVGGPDEEASEATTPATDGGDLRPPNAD